MRISAPLLALAATIPHTYSQHTPNPHWRPDFFGVLTQHGTKPTTTQQCLAECTPPGSCISIENSESICALTCESDTACPAGFSCSCLNRSLCTGNHTYNNTSNADLNTCRDTPIKLKEGACTVSTVSQRRNGPNLFTLNERRCIDPNAYALIGVIRGLAFQGRIFEIASTTTDLREFHPIATWSSSTSLSVCPPPHSLFESRVSTAGDISIEYDSCACVPPGHVQTSASETWHRPQSPKRANKRTHPAMDPSSCSPTEPFLPKFGVCQKPCKIDSDCHEGQRCSRLHDERFCYNACGGGWGCSVGFKCDVPGLQGRRFSCLRESRF